MLMSSNKAVRIIMIELHVQSTNLLDAKVANRNEVDKVIEDEITNKLADDLIQSIEKKFHVDLERSLDMIMTKIHLLLQNGTQSVQDRLMKLQASFHDVQDKAPDKFERCLQGIDNDTLSLSEGTLHQMVVCGYALIGQDPVHAVNQIHTLKNMIREEVKPMNAEKKGIYELLRVCGHEHDSLKKVVKCVISKSPALKSVLMSVTGKLIDGIVGLTKTLAHGAMHEACLIEVMKAAEDEADKILAVMRKCVHNETALRPNEDSNEDRNPEKDVNDGDIPSTSKFKEGSNRRNVKVTKGNDVGLKSKSDVLVDIKNDLNALNTYPMHKNID